MTSVSGGTKLGLSRSEDLASRIEQQILDKAVDAGDRLGTKEDLRTRFGVAAGTVNEAIRLLEARGLVRSQPGPGGGIFVTAPSPQMQLSNLIVNFRREGAGLLECLEVRNVLEPALADSAAQNMTPESAARLFSLIDEMRASTSDPQRYLECNWELHRQIAEMCTNTVLRGVYIAVLNFLSDQVSSVDRDKKFAETVQDNLARHLVLVEAIASGDGSRARAAAEDHAPLIQNRLTQRELDQASFDRTAL